MADICIPAGELKRKREKEGERDCGGEKAQGLKGSPWEAEDPRVRLYTSVVSNAPVTRQGVGQRIPHST